MAQFLAAAQQQRRIYSDITERIQTLGNGYANNNFIDFHYQHFIELEEHYSKSVTIHQRNLQVFAILLYKIINNEAPEIIHKIFYSDLSTAL